MTMMTMGDGYNQRDGYDEQRWHARDDDDPGCQQVALLLPVRRLHIVGVGVGVGRGRLDLC